MSIETQRMMLTGFCYERGFKIYEVYTDDGYSGLNSVSGTTYYLYDQLGRLINSYHPGTGLRATYTYDANNRLTDTYYTVSGWSGAYEEYTYNTSTTDNISDGTLTGMRILSGANISLSYDYLQRLTTRNIASKLTETYTYKAGSGTNATSTLVNGKKNTLGSTVKSNFTYTYDANGNILTEYNSVSGKTVTYTYDSQNQLLKAVHSDGRTETYTYDTVGNIQNFNNGTTSHSYTYGNSVWRDLLTAVDGTTISYDTVGNPISYYNGSSYTMSWIEGRRLASVTTGGAATSYQYDESGIRTRKTKSDGSYIIYLVADGTVIGEKHYSSSGSVTKHMRYIFDENGTVCGYATSTNGTSWSYYYFIRNLQGDVLQVFNSSNTVVAEYTYDSWGNILSATGTQASVNPFRYRGYYYDAESGFYYVSSRYYDPEVGRFINADAMVSTGQSIIGFNMFAYCLNNPIRLVDYSGMRPADICAIAVGDGGDWPGVVQVSPIKKLVNKVTEVVKSAVEYVTNDDEQKVLDAEYFAFYKGVPVVKVPFMNREAASFGIIFLGSNADERRDADQIVQHEYGHTVQLDNMGGAIYTATVAIPSVIGNRVDASGNMPFNYYSQPWEYGADLYGGVTSRAYDSWAFWIYPVYAIATSAVRSTFPKWP